MLILITPTPDWFVTVICVITKCCFSILLSQVFVSQFCFPRFFFVFKFKIVIYPNLSVHGLMSAITFQLKNGNKFDSVVRRGAIVLTSG